MRTRFYFVLLASIGFASASFAEGDPPGRVARINYTEGAASFAPAGDNEFTDAELNRPLVRGDKLWTDKGVRAEVQAGSATVRMDGRSQLTLLALDDQATQLSLTQGTLYLRVRTLPEGENFEVDTPNLAWRASYPGDYRIDVDRERGVTRVTIHSGTGAVYGEKGEALPMGGGQQITFKGRALAQVDSKEQPPQDNFDRWAAERNRRDDQSVAARYVPREVVGYQLLDATGVWQQDANYGVVWVPQGMPATWAPYRDGRWDWIAPWGWTWIDEKPWAFVTSHYGRWALLESKWAWVPGRMGVRPIYSPALVAFVGSGGGPLAIGGKQSVAWFPLAPGEAWQPGFGATPLYISSVNANMPPQAPAKYAFQSRPEALTAIASDDFARGKPAKGSWLRVAANALGSAQVVAPPPMPEHAKRTMTARAPQPSTDIKPAVDNRLAVAQQQAEAQRQRAAAAAQAEQERAQREQVAKAEQAKAAEQARAAAEQTRRAEQQKVAEQQKLAGQRDQREQQAKAAAQQRSADQQKVAQRERADQAKREAMEQQAKREAAEQARREAVAKRTEQARRDQVAAKREQARREQVAALAREREAKREQAVAKVREQREQRELVARRAQDAKRLAAAKKEDEARRVAQLDLARRAAERDAQVLAAQRVERETAIRRVAEEREKERAQREAWQKQQQAIAEQFRRDQQLYEEQQRKVQQRQRPDLRRAPSQSEPEVWQRGIPVLNPGRTS